MSEILARATRAICQRAYPPHSSDCCGACGVLEQQARAVLASLREPTEAMAEAGFHAACRYDNGDTVPSLEIGTAAWQAMIDEALK